MLAAGWQGRGCDGTPLSPPALQPGRSLALQWGSQSLWVAGMGTPLYEPRRLDVTAMEVCVLEQQGCAHQAPSAALAPAPSPQSWHRAVRSSATPGITFTFRRKRGSEKSPAMPSGVTRCRSGRAAAHLLPAWSDLVCLPSPKQTVLKHVGGVVFGKSPPFAYKSCFLVQDFQHPVPSKQHCRGVAGGFQKYVVFLTQCLSTGFIHRLQQHRPTGTRWLCCAQPSPSC